MKSFVSGITLGLIALPLLLSPLSSQAQKVTIFEVRKDLKLADDDPTFKDYYINAGFDEGLREGTVLDVVRRIPIHDSLKNQAQGDLVLVIAKVKVMHVQKNISVARLYSTTTARQRPVADFNAIMIGDELDLSSAMVPVKSKEKEAAGAAAPKPAPVEPAAVQLAPQEKTERQPAKEAAVRPTHAQAPVPVGGEVTAGDPPSLKK